MKMLLVNVILAGLIPALIARYKGRSFLTWWFYGSCLFLIALPHSILIARMRECPQCAEPIRSHAKVCRHCGSMV